MAFAKQMRKTLEKTTKEVVTNKYVLYTMLFLAIVNVLGYLGTGNYIALLLFSLIGLLTSYFTKNMIIILLVTIISTSLLHISRLGVEAMTNKMSKKSKDDEEGDDDMNEDDDEDEDDNDAPVVAKGAKVNHQKTMEESYANLENVLGNKNFKKMTKDTNKLLEQQNKLTESLNGMAPLLQNAQQMLQGFDMDKMNSMMNSLGAIGGSDDEKKKN